MQTISKLNCNVNALCLTMDVKMTVADRLREFGSWFADEREKAGVPSRLAAIKAGINPVQLSRIENGHSGARRQTIIDVVEAINKYTETGYQVDVNEALRRGGFATDNVPLEEGLARGLDKLPPGRRKLALRQMQSILDSLADEEDDFDYGDFGEDKKKT